MTRRFGFTSNRDGLAAQTLFHHQIKATGKADRVGQGFAFQNPGLIKQQQGGVMKDRGLGVLDGNVRQLFDQAVFRVDFKDARADFINTVMLLHQAFHPQMFV